MARKKKTEEVVEKIVVEEVAKEEKVDFTEAMNPPEEVKVEETVVVEEQPKKRVIKFTPVGPRVEYI